MSSRIACGGPQAHGIYQPRCTPLGRTVRPCLLPHASKSSCVHVEGHLGAVADTAVGGGVSDVNPHVSFTVPQGQRCRQGQQLHPHRLRQNGGPRCGSDSGRARSSCRASALRPRQAEAGQPGGGGVLVARRGLVANGRAGARGCKSSCSGLESISGGRVSAAQTAWVGVGCSDGRSECSEECKYLKVSSAAGRGQRLHAHRAGQNGGPRCGSDSGGARAIGAVRGVLPDAGLSGVGVAQEAGPRGWGERRGWGVVPC